MLRLVPVLSCGLVWALLILPAAGLHAQEEGSDLPGEVFFETIDVNIVNLEVYVTDRQGNPVTDLTVGDFELYEDGRRVEITHFHRVEGGRITVAPARPEADVEPKADEPSVQEIEPLPLDELPLPEEQRLHLVVYIDNLNIRPFNRTRVFSHLRSFLHRHLTRDDRIMLVTFDRSVNIRRPFTYDPDAVTAALDDIATLSAHAVHADSDRHDILEAIAEARAPGQVRLRMERYAEARYNDMAVTVEALRDFIQSLAGVPGRKAVLYVSDGMPMIVGEDIYYAANSRFPGSISLTEVHRFDMSRRFQTLATLANANRVTFYMLDAAGLRPPSSAGVLARFPGLTTMLDTIQITNLHSPLRLLSERTGGRAILNTHDFGPELDRVASDFGNYYSLGYRPPRIGDGRYHRIEVKVNRPGVRVRHREGYRSKRPEVRMSERVEGALVYGIESNPMRVAVRVAGNEPTDRGLYRVFVQVLIPTSEVVLLEQGDLHVGRLRLFVAARDSDGREAPVQEVPVPVRLGPEHLERQYLIYPMQLLLRGGSQRIAVGVWDEIAGSGSLLSDTIEVGGR